MNRLLVLSTAAVLTYIVTFASQPISANSTSSGSITGAGAHFSWLVFDGLKAELEKMTGRTLNLYGEGSLLGVGCNAGIKTALKNKPGKETFGFTCCAITDKEITMKKILVHPIALEPVLVVTNKLNPVKNLTSQQVTAIFKGKILNWKEVGGDDKPILVVARLHCKKRPGHWRKIVKNHDEIVQKRLNVKSAAAMVEKINSLPNAIGHIGSAWKYKDSDRVKAIFVNGREPIAENLQNKSYPYFRQLSAVTDKNPSADIMKMITYAQTSESFKKIAHQYNLLPLN